MEEARGSSLALPASDATHTFGKRRLISRPPSQIQFDFGRSRPVAMHISGRSTDRPPPALPPPRFNHDLDNGHDIAWRIQNDLNDQQNNSRLPPIKPGSSLLRGRSPDSAHDRESVGTQVEHDPARAKGSYSPVPPQSLATGINIPILSRRSPSSSGINQRLQGENPLSQVNHTQSSNAYDKSLLSKIGKSPGHTRHSSKETDALSHTLSIQTKAALPQPRSVHDPPSTVDSINKWLTSPTSATFSPDSTRPSRSEYTNRPPSPRGYRVNRHSPHAARASESQHHSGRPHPPAESLRSPSACQSFDSYSSDPDRRWEESNFTNSCISDRPRPAGTQGFKRRALLPSIDTSKDGDHNLPRDAARPPPKPAYSYMNNSHSTHTSEYQAPSFVSSRGQSTMTSYSSYDARFPRESLPASFGALAHPTNSPISGLTPLRAQTETTVAPRMSMQNLDRNMSSSRIPNQFVCTCCPKKPRKFDTEEKLRQHENEKQYTCAYCNNRFKNKNEAERHQNSLHLRKHSWSCSAIASPQAAFYPSNLSRADSASDICAFCGQEFPNEDVDWDERYEHLTSAHKFGECNLSKKFYRADHFRQHLKHSHGGKSGKWTNTLEANCLREEAMSESASQSPPASEHGSTKGVGSRLSTKTSTSISTAVQTDTEVPAIEDEGQATKDE